MATIVTRETGATAVNRTLTNAELDNNFINLNTDLGNKQPLDADLTAIAALAGTSGLLKKTAADTWSLDTSTYATQTYVGTQIANLVSSAPAALDTLNELATALGSDPNFATTVSTALGNKQPLDADLTAIAALSGTNGFLKKTGDGAWSIDTSTYLTSYTDTLASVTGRGASTSTNLSLTGGSLTISGSNGANLYLSADNVFRWIAGTTGYGVGSGFGLYSDTLGAYFTSLSTSGNWYFGTNTHNSSYRISISGTGYATNDFRAPIFYDSDNTAYYLDPNNTSTSLRYAGYLIQSNTGSYGLKTSSSNAHLHLDDSWNNIHLKHSSGGFYLDVNSHHFRDNAGTTEWALINSDYLYHYSDIRTPIFYDSDNTGYYIDPAGSSVSASLYGPIVMASTAWTGEVSGKIQYHSNNWYFQYASWFHFRNTGGGNTFYGDYDGNTWSSISSRAPIFYDSNDTTYYLDPNSTGLSLKIAGNIDLYARSASWAEGIRVRVPSTNTWGGIRFTRDRGNDDGNWAIGYTGQDSTDDLTFWSNNNGDGGGFRVRITKAGTMTINGALNATTKSFLIKHPTKPNMKLRYGSLEGPENGVYVRGRGRGSKITLPDYWTALVDEDTITVTLTPIGKHQKLYVEKVEANAVWIANDGLFSSEPNYYYVVYAERKDVDSLEVEIPE
jgi:hypothetical protein